MAQKLKLRELGMDTMERLYYERQNERKRAYATKKRKKSTMRKTTSVKSSQTKYSSDTNDLTTRQSIYNVC